MFSGSKLLWPLLASPHTCPIVAKGLCKGGGYYISFGCLSGIALQGYHKRLDHKSRDRGTPRRWVHANFLWWVPNPPVANRGVAERAPWRSTKRGVAGVSNLLEMPTDSCHFPCTSDTLIRPQKSLAQKALSTTKGLARGRLGTLRFLPTMPTTFGTILLSVLLSSCSDLILVAASGYHLSASTSAYCIHLRLQGLDVPLGHYFEPVSHTGPCNASIG